MVAAFSVELTVQVGRPGLRVRLQIEGQIVTNLGYADDIILLATSEAELQELVEHLDSVSRKYSLSLRSTRPR